MVITAWFGLMTPAGTPGPIIEKLYQAIRDVVQSPEITKRFHDMGGRAEGNSPAEFAAFIEQERMYWSATANAAGLVVEP